MIKQPEKSHAFGMQINFRAKRANNPKETGEYLMNWDQIEGRWKQMRGHVKREWGRLTDDDLDQIEGQQEKLVGLVQEAYGVKREEADRQVRNWFDRL